DCAFGKPELKRNVAIFDVAKFAQPGTKGLYVTRRRRCRDWGKHANNCAARRLLRPDSERVRGSSPTNQSNELPALHIISPHPPPSITTFEVSHLTRSPRRRGQATRAGRSARAPSRWSGPRRDRI